MEKFSILSNEDISRTGKIPILELMGAAYIKHGTSQKAKNGLLCWRKAMELRQSTFPKILTSFPNELRRYLETLASLKRWRNYINQGSRPLKFTTSHSRSKMSLSWLHSLYSSKKSTHFTRMESLLTNGSKKFLSSAFRLPFSQVADSPKHFRNIGP